MRFFLVLAFVTLSFAQNWEKFDPVLRRSILNGERGITLKTYTNIDKVKVLRKDGKVEVVSLSQKNLENLEKDPTAIYIEAPRKLKLLDDVSTNSSYVVWGHGTQQVDINYNKPFFGYIFGGSVSAEGCIQNSLFFQCSSATKLNVTALNDYRLLLFAPDIKGSDIQGGDRKYLVGTRSSISTNTGKGVVVGIVDSGINFCHPAFRNADGTTRILFYKDYTGIELSEAQINNMIRMGSCNYDGEGHGTAVASIAGGYWSMTRYNSQTKDVKFIVYKTNLYDTDVMAGLDYIKSKAQSLSMPAVVNLSLGGQLDPHDGTSLLDRYVDELSGPGFIVVVSAGNEGNERIHARLSSGNGDIHIYVSSNVEVDGWYTKGSSYTVQVCDQTTANCVGANPGNLANAQINTTSCFAYIDNRTLSSQLNGDGEVYLQISCLNPTDLTIRLTKISGSGKMDMWMSGDGNFLDGQVDDGFGGFSYTISSPGTAKNVITVGAIGANYISTSRFDNYGRVAYFSSRGPTRDGRIKPDVVADGFFQCTANANFSGNTDPNLCGPPGGGTYYIAIGGTSFSAPVVVSLVAMYMQSNPSADPMQVRNWLISNAFYDTEGTPPNVAYGYGKAVWVETSTTTNVGEKDGQTSSGGGCSMGRSSPVNTLIYSLFILIPLMKKLWKIRKRYV